MEDRSHALLAGLFVLLLGVAVTAAYFWLRDTDEPRDRYLLVTTGSVSGLGAQAPVRLRGVQIGRVESVRFDPENPRQILVAIRVDRGAPITRETRAQLGFQGVTGIAHVSLSDGGSAAERLVPDPANPPRVPMDPSLLDQLRAGGPELIADIEEVAARVSRLLSDDNLARVSATLLSAQRAGERLAALAERAGPVVDASGGLVREAGGSLRRVEQLAGELTTLTREAGARLDDVERTLRAAERMGEGGRAVSDTLLNVAWPQMSSFMDELARNARAIERAVVDLQSQPHSLLFGRSPAAPGPGEAGYVIPPWPPR
jgi:phospholipid/cholesterol/gamma-HCH transport system substrate-binding protein